MSTKQSIKAIILAGGPKLEQCPVAAPRLPKALWPIAGKPVLEHLLDCLANQGVNQVMICSIGNNSLLKESVHLNNKMNIKFVDEQLPIGTAGCIRDATCYETDSLLLVLPVNMTCPPKINSLISIHRENRFDLTVVFNPASGNGNLLGEPAGIYVCESSVLEHIPKEGYFDIKEGLIPEMIRAGKTVQAVILPKHAGNFRDRQGYLCAIANYLEGTPQLNRNLKACKGSDLKTIWVADDVNIDPSVKIQGPVTIMDGAHISKDTVIIGPTEIGKNVTIAENSVVINSSIWDGARIGSNCQIYECIIDYDTAVPDNTIAQKESILFEARGILKGLVSDVMGVVKNNASRLQHILSLPLYKINEKLPNQTLLSKNSALTGLAAIFVLIAFFWSYWPNLKELWNIWQRSDEYSSGLLVPFIAIYILWSRRHRIAQCSIRTCVWGIFAFVTAQAVRFFGSFFIYRSAERLSIVLSIIALVILLFGWELYKKAFTVSLFLFLMLPWPNRVQAAVALPLQRWATSSAVFCLEMLGYEVLQEGNIIHIGNATVAVAEACNGLRMVTAFFVISGLVVLLVKRTLWEKLIILMSSLPIALLCNTTRLTITAIAFTVLKGENWEKIFHDFGGYAMMPLALVMIVAELWLLIKLTTSPTEEQTIIITRQNR
jgi:exosortase